MLLWCICPLFSSFTNDLGLHDGCAEALQQAVIWGVPYWLGRLYLVDRDGLRFWAAALAVGGVVYTLPCLVEIRLSPQLHYWVYGFYQHQVNQSERFGGFRRDVTIADSLWIITLGNNGLFGLTTLGLALLLPAARFVCLYPPQRWIGVHDAPAAVALGTLLIYVSDHLCNAMLDPIFVLAAGGLASASSATPPPNSRRLGKANTRAARSSACNCRLSTKPRNCTHPPRCQRRTISSRSEWRADQLRTCVTRVISRSDRFAKARALW